MIQKNIYLFFSILIFSFSFLGCKYEREDNKKQLPNIVWLVAEDQSPEFFPVYGDSTVKLPIIESLAKDSVSDMNNIINEAKKVADYLEYGTVPVKKK